MTLYLIQPDRSPPRLQTSTKIPILTPVEKNSRSPSMPVCQFPKTSTTKNPASFSRNPTPKPTERISDSRKKTLNTGPRAALAGPPQIPGSETPASIFTTSAKKNSTSNPSCLLEIFLPIKKNIAKRFSTIPLQGFTTRIH